MTGEQQDKMIDKIIDEFKGYAMIGNIVHQKDWYDLAEDIVKLFAIPDVSCCDCKKELEDAKEAIKDMQDELNYHARA